MAVTEQNESRANDCIRALDESNLPGALKEDLRAVIRSAEEGTNGLSPEESMQCLKQGFFDLARITVYNMIHESKREPRTWKDVVVETRTQICVLAAIAAVALILRPELANIARAITGNGP